jgi:hypothetical protein
MAQLEIRVEDEGPWKGVRFNLKARKGNRGSEAILIPQVGARSDANAKWQWFKVNEISADIAAAYPKGSEFQVVATNSKEQAAVIGRLKKVGIDYHPKRKLPAPTGLDGKIGARLEALFTDQIQRCIAKQAFNYLAKVTSADFVLKDDFDEIRAYILHGAKPAHRVVRPIQGSFIFEERYGGIATAGHILSVEWSPDNQSVVSRMALFNAMKYLVVLCNRYNGIWVSGLQHAHHFDIQNRAVAPLHITNLAVPIFSVVRAPTLQIR